ncbi:unnamed protein product [Blepharisma stoltei]|uniref:Uncharacterized protein n=1 Tax=Blepharisma stoltei TaxID=1481888 RepID=A0AAU9II24_9CILI|nr:unnamed protein product [Blepharisma stoltei]
MLKNKMDSLHVIPGKGLGGQFTLGMSITKAINKFKNLSTKIPEVQVVEEIETKRIYLIVPDCRIKLVFDELYQKLIIIEINCTECEAPNILIVFKSQMYSNYQEILNDLEDSFMPNYLDENIILETYHGMSIIRDQGKLSKILIHKGNKLPEIQGIQMPKINEYLVYLNEKIIVKTPNGKSIELAWGSFPETVIEILGPPDELFYKQSQNVQSNDYFYNYFSEGFDLMFDGNSNQLKKAILYTNMPDYYLFNEYDRCNFKLFVNEHLVNPLTKWDEIIEIFEGHPKDEGNRRYPYGFEPTRYFSFKGVLFEVSNSGYIGSITISL